MSLVVTFVSSTQSIITLEACRRKFPVLQLTKFKALRLFIQWLSLILHPYVGNLQSSFRPRPRPLVDAGTSSNLPDRALVSELSCIKTSSIVTHRATFISQLPHHNLADRCHGRFARLSYLHATRQGRLCVVTVPYRNAPSPALRVARIEACAQEIAQR